MLSALSLFLCEVAWSVHYETEEPAGHAILDCQEARLGCQASLTLRHMVIILARDTHSRS